ncbi:hypothetical protein H0H93_012392 [Arthromyces matolae]|nr:hypothetical protein H0H93_012392 [Arthromyces matolae]
MDHPPETKAVESDLETQEDDLLVTARACVNAKEFKRAIHMLRDCKSSKARFLSIYSQFIASEKQAQRDWHKLDNNRQQPAVPVNNSLNDLLELVCNATDPWLLFFLWVMSLRACVLYHTHDFGQAEAQFEKILALDPYRIDDIDVYSNILYVTDNKLKLSRLAHEFLALDKDRPEVCCLVGERAVFIYVSAAGFEYQSGNHYSLRAEHEKAVKYFRRATQLDRTYLSAWTLMGHEYVEMKNSHAAIEAYRRAVGKFRFTSPGFPDSLLAEFVTDVNRKDYRAWYGLGQAYELLSMHNYALHYYQHATALRPYDVRLWQAQGMCYEEIGRLRDAVECLKHALIPADPHEITINLKLARLYYALEEPAAAVAYHRKVVEICRADVRPVQDYAKSSLEVAEYQIRIPNGDLVLARDYLEIVASSNSEDVGKAAELLKTMSNVLAPSFHVQTTSKSLEQSNGISPVFDILTPQTFAVSTDSPSPGPSSWRTSTTLPSTTPHKRPHIEKNRTKEELEIIEKGRARLSSLLASDHALVLNPDTDTPFQDTTDVVHRLLPYHVLLQPQEDLETLRKDLKGKGKAIVTELQEEIRETRFAIECHERRDALLKRFRNIQTRQGKVDPLCPPRLAMFLISLPSQRSAPDDQAVLLASLVLDVERSETTVLSNELRTARAEQERRDKEKRLAATYHNAGRPLYYPGAINATAATPLQAQYYRGYPYAYTQVYGTPAQTTPTPTFAVPPPPLVTPTPVQSAIPVQLPVASLPALHALGIIPVPASSVSSDGQPQPAAVLRGSTSNGTMLSLEINVSSLQSAQMSGLAMVLNSLMSKSSTATSENQSSNVANGT